MVKRALSSGTGGCDPEEQSVRVEALNALMETDRDVAQQLAGKVLARCDECSIRLRRNALFLRRAGAAHGGTGTGHASVGACARKYSGADPEE